MSVVVSITPSAINRDSRTFKQAASFSRLGHRSVVVEGEPSPAGAGAGHFELIAAPGARGVPAPAGPGPAPAGLVSAPQHDSPRLNLAGRARVAVVNSLEPLRRSRQTLRINREITPALPAADLYVAHGWNRLPAAWSAARRHGAAVLYDAHDSYFERYPDGESGYASSLTERVLAAYEGATARRCAGFVTATEGVADLLEHRIGRRPTVVFNYPDTRLDRDPEGDVRTAVGADADAILLVSVGNAKPGTDVEAGLDAIARLPDRFQLVLIGAGTEGYRGPVADRGLGSRVHLLSPLPPDRINRFIASADAGLILYWGITRDFDHALPNRLFHAVAAGLPVLFPELPAIGALARRHGLGLPVDSRDPVSIATAARRLAGDPATLQRLRASVAAAGRELAWERQKPRLSAAIEDAFRDGRPGRG